MADHYVTVDKLQRYHDGIKAGLVQPAYATSEDPLTLSLTDGGTALTPTTNKLYLILNGTYIDQLFTYNGTTYIAVSGSTSGPKLFVDDDNYISIDYGS